MARRKAKRLPSPLPSRYRKDSYDEFLASAFYRTGEGGIVPDDPWKSQLRVSWNSDRERNREEEYDEENQESWTAQVEELAEAFERYSEILKALTSSEQNIKVFRLPGGTLEVTYRLAGVHSRITLGEGETWRVEFWAFGSNEKTRWLSFPNPFNDVDSSLGQYDISMQDLTVACLDREAPHKTTVLEKFAAGAGLEWPHYQPVPPGTMVVQTFEDAVFAFRTEWALGKLADQTGNESLAVYDTEDDPSGWPNKRILAGMTHGYFWSFTSGYTLEVTPPEHTPAVPWWSVHLHSLVAPFAVESSFGVPIGVPHPYDENLVDFFALALSRLEKVHWFYWFKETHRGNSLAGGQVMPEGFSAEGVPLWRGSGMTSAEAYLNAKEKIWGWNNPDWMLWNMGVIGKVRNSRLIPPGSPLRKRKRHRGSRPRKRHRIDINETPLFEDPRDFGVWLPLSSI